MKLEQARKFFAEKKYKKALPLLKKVNANKSKKNFETLNFQAFCHFSLGQFQLASIVWENALKYNIESPIEKGNTLRNLAVCYVNQTKLEDAIRCLNRAVSVDNRPDVAIQFLQLSDLNSKLNNSEEVINNAKRLLNITQYRNKGMLLLIDSYIKLDDIESAREIMQKAKAELDNFDKELQNRLVGYFAKIGNKRDIELLLSRFSEIYAKDDLWFQSLVEFFARSSTEIEPGHTNEDDLEAPIPNEQIIGSTPEAVKLIKTLVSTLEEKGAYFHPKLRFVETDGNLSVQAYTSVDKFERLMSSPLACMPLINDYKFSLDESSQLVAKPKKSMMSEGSGEIMALLVELYNASDKINQWRQSSPFIALSEHLPFLEKLALPFMSGVLANYIILLKAKQLDKLTIDSFLGSRVFLYKKDVLARQKVKIKTNSEFGLLGVIDFLNHRMGVPGYRIDEKVGELNIVSTPDTETKEVFVQYNLEDPLKTFLIYGFVDTLSPFLFCIPCRLRLENKNVDLQILNRHVSIFEELIPPKLKFMSSRISGGKREGSSVTIGAITIPSGDKLYLLVEELRFQLSTLMPEGTYSSEAQIESDVFNLIEQIYKHNINYWQEIESSFNSLVESENNISELMKEQITTLYEFCLGHLRTGQARLGFLVN